MKKIYKKKKKKEEEERERREMFSLKSNVNLNPSMIVRLTDANVLVIFAANTQLIYLFFISLALLCASLIEKQTLRVLKCRQTLRCT